MHTEEIYIPGTQVIVATLIYGVPNDNAKSRTNFVTDNSRSIQVGVLHRTEGTVVEAHQHLPVQKTVNGCQEVLIIKSGTVSVDIYDPSKNHITVRTLRTGDIFIQYWGGHSFHFLTDTQFIEIKQGPYTPADKVFFNPLSHESVK